MRAPLATVRLPGLDFLRSLAVIMVILFHYAIASDGAMFSMIGPYGWMGVDLFFVLSGYLIGSQFFAPLARGGSISLKRFFLRRILRTLPNFLVVLAIYFAFDSLRERATIAPLWRFLTFTMNLGLDRASTGSFTHAWSLCVEEQFYLALPIATVLFMRHRSVVGAMSFLVMGFLAGMVLRAALWVWLVEPARLSVPNFLSFYDQQIYYPTYTRLDGLLIGVSLALVKAYRPQVWQKWLDLGWWACGASIVFFSLAVALNQHKFSLYGAAFLYPCVALSFGALTIAFLSPRVFLARVRVPGVARLASLSYGIYLVQKIVFRFCDAHFSAIGVETFSALGFLLTMGACVIAAFLLYGLIERPFLKLRDRLV